VHESDVIVENKEVEDEHCKLDQQSQEQPHDACVLCFLVIVVQLEQVTVRILVRKVDNVHNEEVQHRSQPVPSDDLAKLNREAEDMRLGKVAGEDHKAENKGVRQVAH
jgi:hypothetical protein